MCILEVWFWWYLTLECNCRQPLNLIQPNDNDWKLSEKSKANRWGGDKTLHSAKLISAFLACVWNSQTKEFCHRLPWKRPVWQSARSWWGSAHRSVMNIYNWDQPKIEQWSRERKAPNVEIQKQERSQQQDDIQEARCKFGWNDIQQGEEDGGVREG